MPNEGQVGKFRPLSPEEILKYTKALRSSRATSEGLVIDSKAGTIIESANLDSADSTKRNMIGKFDTHY